MAIPLSNEMREVRAPRTADLKAVNPNPAANQLAQAGSSFYGALGNFGEAGVKLAKQVERQDDAYKRDEAERVLTEKTTYWKTELEKQPLEKRKAFQRKYEAGMNRALDEYRSSINKVGDFEIREGSKRHVNAVSQRTASNYEYENWKNETELREKTLSQALLSANEQRLQSITAADTADSLTNFANDPNLGFAHAEQQIRNFYGGRMGMPKEVVEQMVKDYKSKGAVAMANRLAQVTDNVSNTTSYDQSLKFIDNGIKQGFINANEGIEAKRTLEMQKIDMVAAIQPGSLVNTDGTYNFDDARRFAPDLTQKELYQHISNSKGKGAGNAGAGIVQEQMSQIAVENWNDATKRLGRAGEYATEQYKKDRKDSIAKSKPATGREILDLVELYTLGEDLLNGVAVVNGDGTYTDPKTGMTTQTVATGTKRILQKQHFTELQTKVNSVKARMADMIESGKFRDIFNPTVLQQSQALNAREKIVLSNLMALYKAKGGKTDGWVTRNITRPVLEGLGLKRYGATQGVGVVETFSNIRGSMDALGEIQRKYPQFDPNSYDELQMRMPVNLMQYNSQEGKYEPIPNMPPVPLKKAIEMEVGYATLMEMDDGMFQSIYGETAQKPQNVAQMIQYGYELDFKGGSDKKVANTLNKFFGIEGQEAMGNALMPLMGTVQRSVVEAFGLNTAPAFGFTDAQVYKTFSDAGNAIKKAFSGTNYSGTGMPTQQMQDVQFQNTQFLNKIFSGKPGNEALSYDEFTVQEGAATPDTYNDYLAERGAYLRTLGTIQQTDALNADKPANFFLVTSDEANSKLDDMYFKSMGMAPSDPKYISEDVNVDDILNGSAMIKAPSEPFGESQVYTQFKKFNVDDSRPLFFVRENDNGYVLHNGKMKTIDCNAYEFVTLLGIAMGVKNAPKPNVETSNRYTIPSNMISNQFK